MQIIAKRTLKEFWLKQSQAEAPLKAWHSTVRTAKWTNSHDVRAMFNSADFVADNRVIFDIGGNKYRIVAHVSYTFGRVLIKFVGTHAEYDKIDPEKV